MAEKVASLYGELNLEDNMTPALKKAEGNLSSFGGALKKAGSKVADFGAGLLKMSAPVVAGFGIAVSAAMGFDESITNTAAVMGLTRDQAAALGDQLLQIGADSQAGPQAVADAYYDIAGGVADASTHMAIMEAAIATAEAGNADLGETTRALISIMNSYEYGAYDAAYASDVMTRTVGMGVGTMNDLAGAMPQVAGLANSLGIEFEDLGTMMAYLSTKGNTFSESATQISALMTAMIKPNEKMTAALKDMGFATGQAAIDALGLQGAYQAMVDAGYGDQMAAITGSVEALRGVTSLTTPVVADLGNAMIPLGPNTREAATQMAGLAGAFNNIPNTGLMATGFGQLASVMTTMPDTSKNWLGLGDALWALPDITGLANKFDLVDIATRKAAGGFLAFDEVFAGGRAGATESNRETQLTSLKAQMRDLTTDMEALAITTGTAVAPALTQVWDGLKPVIGGVTEFVKNNPGAVSGFAQLAVGAAVLGTIMMPLGWVVGGLGTALTVVRGAVAGVTAVAAFLYPVLVGLATGFTGVVVAIGSGVVTGLTGIAMWGGKAAMALGTGASMGLWGAVTGIGGALVAAAAVGGPWIAFGLVVAGLASKFDNIATSAGNAGRAMADALGIASAPIQVAGVTIGRTGDNVKPLAQNLVQQGRNLGVVGNNSVGNAVTGAADWLSRGGGRAGGGGFMGGQAITVGENGREVVQFGSAGRVFNRQQMGSMGGVTINNLILNGINDPQALFDAVAKVSGQRSPS